MKQLLSITAVLMILFVGCSEQVNINSPENLVNTQEPNWITLPKSEELNVEASYSASEWVSGYYGDKIYLYKSYYVHYFNKVTISAKIDFSQQYTNDC